jgi:hypothetical protein
MARPSARERAGQTLRQLVKKLFAVLNKPGVRRLWAELRVRGWRLSKKRVWRLMRLCQLAGRHPRTRKKTTIQSGRPAGAPDLVGRRFTAERPDQKCHRSQAFLPAAVGAENWGVPSGSTSEHTGTGKSVEVSGAGSTGAG